MVSRSRMPPPSCKGISSPMTLTISRIAISFLGLPANAPLRSTRCSRSAPRSSQWRAIAAGSSENTVADCISPCFRRTQLPSLISIAGMICMSAGVRLLQTPPWQRARIESGAAVPGDEVGKQLETGAVTLLGMELHGKDISACNRASKRHRVFHRCGGQPRIIRHRVIAVGKIESCVICDPMPQGMALLLVHRAPTHVRHLESMPGAVFHLIVTESNDPSRQHAQTGSGSFLAVVE